MCLDHSLAPHVDASPHPDPQPPWTPCHLVMWSPPTRRTADATNPSTAADSSAPKKKDRPYFLAELADLTIAPDIYNCDDDDHNLMEYEVSLGTQQLLTTELLSQGRVTLATTHPIAIHWTPFRDRVRSLTVAEVSGLVPCGTNRPHPMQVVASAICPPWFVYISR